MTEHGVVMAEQTRSLPYDAAAPRLARRFVGECCVRWGIPPTACETLALLTSEVVTNAVLHARGPIQLRVTRQYAALRVEVRDDSPHRPVERQLRPYSTEGRGMTLVRSLSAVWGVAEEIPGRTVWFELTA